MMRALLTAAALAVVVRTASAQGVLSDAKAKAQKAAAATNAHIEAEQRPDGQTKQAAKPQAAAPAPKSQAKTPAPGSRAAAPAQKVERPGGKLAVPAADTAGPPPTIMREMYVYAADGRRDPFVSLLTTSELRPTLSDLRLTAILYDHSSARRSVATLRDIGTNAQYRVSQGSKLGRMTVAAIRLKSVLFTIDEFGTTRQDSLVLGDTTKVRVR
jgi:hypothetical protein